MTRVAEHGKMALILLRMIVSIATLKNHPETFAPVVDKCSAIIDEVDGKTNDGLAEEIPSNGAPTAIHLHD